MNKLPEAVVATYQNGLKFHEQRKNIGENVIWAFLSNFEPKIMSIFEYSKKHEV